MHIYGMDHGSHKHKKDTLVCICHSRGKRGELLRRWHANPHLFWLMTTKEKLPTSGGHSAFVHQRHLTGLRSAQVGSGRLSLAHLSFVCWAGLVRSRRSRSEIFSRRIRTSGRDRSSKTRGASLVAVSDPDPNEFKPESEQSVWPRCPAGEMLARNIAKQLSLEPRRRGGYEKKWSSRPGLGGQLPPPGQKDDEALRETSNRTHAASHAKA